MSLDPQDGTNVGYDDDDLFPDKTSSPILSPDDARDAQPESKVPLYPEIQSEVRPPDGVSEKTQERPAELMNDLTNGKLEDVISGPDQTASELDIVAPRKTFAGIPIAPVRQVGTTVNILVYGRPGVGKTFWAAGADLVKEMGPCLYISAEAGSSTIKQVAPNMVVIPDPAVRGAVTWEEFEAIYNELADQCYNKGRCEYKTIVIDTITELQKTNMEWVMRQTLADHPDRDPDVPGLHDWGKSTNRMRTYFRRFRDLPLNLICVAHEQEDRDNRGTLWRKPDLPGKLGNQSAAFFDQVMYLYTKQEGDGKDGQAPKTKRVLMTGALEGYVTKDRSGNLPLLVVDPNMSDIYKMITKG
jgi:hypothetical protein